MLGRVIVPVVLALAMVAAVAPRPADAVPAFARQYDLQCNACHTRPPRLNSFGEQFHLMGFQLPSAARLSGLVGSVKEDGPVKALIDSVALRVVGALLEYSESPRETEVKLEPPHEVELFIARALTPEVSLFVELGTVKAVDAAPKTITIASTAKGKTRQVTVHLTPNAKIVKFARPAEPDKSGFVEQPIALADLKPGWVVSVPARHEGDKEVSELVTVVIER